MPRSKKVSASNAQFPERLHDMLEFVEENGLETTISWVLGGRGIMIYDPEGLMKILSLFFEQTKYSSFRRQLNMWGFERVSYGPHKGSFTHPFFVKGNKAICCKMIRQVTLRDAFRRSENNIVGPAAVYETKAEIMRDLESPKMDIIDGCDETKIKAGNAVRYGVSTNKTRLSCTISPSLIVGGDTENVGVLEKFPSVSKNIGIMQNKVHQVRFQPLLTATTSLYTKKTSDVTVENRGGCILPPPAPQEVCKDVEEHDGDYFSDVCSLSFSYICDDPKGTIDVSSLDSDEEDDWEALLISSPLISKKKNAKIASQTYKPKRITESSENDGDLTSGFTSTLNYCTEMDASALPPLTRTEKNESAVLHHNQQHNNSSILSSSATASTYVLDEILPDALFVPEHQVERSTFYKYFSDSNLVTFLSSEMMENVLQQDNHLLHRHHHNQLSRDGGVRKRTRKNEDECYLLSPATSTDSFDQASSLFAGRKFYLVGSDS